MLKSNPSADPGAKIGDGAAHRRPSPFFYPLRDWHQSAKPSRPDAAILPTGCRLHAANASRPEFQFPLNQNMGQSPKEPRFSPTNSAEEP